MSNLISNNVLDSLDELPELVPIPQVAIKLANPCEDSSVSVAELVEIVRCDTTIAVRTLKVANSVRYGCAGRIASIEHAAVVLGSSGLRGVAMSVAASALFDGASNSDSNSAENQLWQHSMGCATVASCLAADVDDACPSEAFVAGLFHDIGKLALNRLVPDYTAFADVPSDEFVEQERSRYGVCHAELGAIFVEGAGLPHNMAEVIRNHHEAFDFEFHSPLSQVVALANRLAKSWQIGSPERTAPDETAEAELGHWSIDVGQLRDSSLSEFQSNLQSFK